MTRNTTHIAKATEALWTVAMGLFLGLTGAMVLSVILTFRGARAIDASPGTAPFNDPQFAKHSNDAVAGYIGQDLFVVGGTVALILLGVALLARIGGALIKLVCHYRLEGSGKVSGLRFVAFVFCLLCMLYGAKLTRQMNAAWPGMYDTAATPVQLDQRRDAFEAMHQQSEKIVGAAWLAGLLALTISPWCRRPADVPLQSGDGEKEVDQKEKHEAEKA
ncbi:MAG: hypothetical protein KTR15_08345 [Phycisphaeraceae bacterium]|nr:hypothetical protein [Phycisphaeraceae bacterium]